MSVHIRRKNRVICMVLATQMLTKPLGLVLIEHMPLPGVIEAGSETSRKQVQEWTRSGSLVSHISFTIMSVFFHILHRSLNSRSYKISHLLLHFLSGIQVWCLLHQECIHQISFSCFGSGAIVSSTIYIARELSR